jgi:hypothetical protein
MKIAGLTLLACFPLLLVVLLCVFGVLSLSSPLEVITSCRVWFTAEEEEEEDPGICGLLKDFFSIIMDTRNGDVSYKLSVGLFITNKMGQ